MDSIHLPLLLSSLLPNIFTFTACGTDTLMSRKCVVRIQIGHPVQILANASPKTTTGAWRRAPSPTSGWCTSREAATSRTSSPLGWATSMKGRYVCIMYVYSLWAYSVTVKFRFETWFAIDFGLDVNYVVQVGRYFTNCARLCTCTCRIGETVEQPKQKST